MVKGMSSRYTRLSSEFLLLNKKAEQHGLSQVYQNTDGTSRLATLQSTGRETTAARGASPQPIWKYTRGAVVTYIDGNRGFTVQQGLACGAFGEVHVVWDDTRLNARNLGFEKSGYGGEYAMKCTKFDAMPKEQRVPLFRKLCDEALVMNVCQPHPNILSLRYVKVSQDDFVSVMDWAEGAIELEEAYLQGTLWTSVDGGRQAWKANRQFPQPPVAKITAVLATLWFQLLNAVDHLHSLRIVHLDVKPTNVLVHPTTLHLHLFGLGLAKEGSINTATGLLEVDCDGCTPAFAGPEMLALMDQCTDGMPAKDRHALNIDTQANLSASSHDLWASTLTIFQAVHSSRVWTRGDEGQAVLAAYWRAQEASLGLGKPVREWNHVETMEQVAALPVPSPDLKAEILQAFETSRVDGMFLASVLKRDALVPLKNLTTVARAAFWTAWQPFIALPFDASMHAVMKKCLSPAPSDRYESAVRIMNALLPIIDASPDMDIFLPTQAKEEVEEYARQVIMVNVGIALFNRGCVAEARIAHERQVAVLDPETMGFRQMAAALNGLKSASALLSIINTTDHSQTVVSALCASGVPTVIEKILKEAIGSDGLPVKAGVACTQLLSALWCMTHQHSENADLVAQDHGLMACLPQILDDCAEFNLPLAALACIGLCACLCPGSDARMQAIIRAGIPSKLSAIITKYAADHHFAIHASTLMFNLAADDVMEEALMKNGAVEVLISNWREHHLDNVSVCCTITETLFNFTFSASFTPKLRGWDVEGLTEQCLENHPSSLPMKTLGEKFLMRMEDQLGKKAKTHSCVAS
jgi:serine/threonine protein kinase